MKHWLCSLAIVALAVAPVSTLAATETNLEPEVLEDLAFRIVDNTLNEDDLELLRWLNHEEANNINGILAKIAEAEQSEEGGEVIDGCENILGWPFAGYSYVRPYRYWLKPEWNGSDLMLEYAFYPPDCSKNHPKAFYVTDWYLYQGLSCGIAVQAEWMEGCKRRVTAVIGFSRYFRFGPGYTANHTLLGFRLR